jgi:hypothetical protein
MTTVRVHNAEPTDMVYWIDLPEGRVTWNVTKLMIAAAAGKFGDPLWWNISKLPPTNYENIDRAKVDAFKDKNSSDATMLALHAPAIAIETPTGPRRRILTFADGNHRVTARTELGFEYFSFHLVPREVEARFRITYEAMP